MDVPTFDLTRRGFVGTSLATGLAGFALATQPVMAQTAIITPTTGLDAEDIKIPTKDGSIPGYIAKPAGKTGLPVVLVVQEIFGLHEHIKDVCRRLAKEGYCAIGADLYSRQGDAKNAPDMAAVSAIAAKVPDAQVMADLDATLAEAVKRGGDGSKVGITGFCWGGRQVWLYAAHNPNLKAGVAWYGRVVGNTNELMPKNPVDVAASIKAPVLGLYGGADAGIPVDSVQKFKEMLPAGNKSEIVVYPDTPHAFNADYRPSYREAAAKDGWAKMLAWFKTNLV